MVARRSCLLPVCVSPYAVFHPLGATAKQLVDCELSFVLPIRFAHPSLRDLLV